MILILKRLKVLVLPRATGSSQWHLPNHLYQRLSAEKGREEETDGMPCRRYSTTSQKDRNARSGAFLSPK